MSACAQCDRFTVKKLRSRLALFKREFETVLSLSQNSAASSAALMPDMEASAALSDPEHVVDPVCL